MPPSLKPTVALNARVDPDTYTAFLLVASERGQSIRAALEEAMADYAKKNAEEPQK